MGDRRTKLEAMERALQDMFQQLADGTPPHLLATFDMLEKAGAEEPKSEAA